MPAAYRGVWSRSKFYTSLHKMTFVHIEAGEGEPVLLLHGYPQSASCWRHQIPALAEHHRVIAADWPGFGRCEPPETPPTYDAEVERIGMLADSFGPSNNLLRLRG